MAYTLTQARPLLTAAELDLFNQSRAEPVKRLAPADLASAVKRTRTLRDKYRDLYRRQTVALRSGTPGAVTGEDNERTQRKADMLQETLERFEARAALLQERGGKAAAKRGTPSGADQRANKSTAAEAPKAPKSSKASKAPARSKGSDKDKDKKTPVSAQLNTLGGVGAQPAAKGAASKDTTAAPAAPRSKAGKPGKAAQRSAKAPSRKAPTTGNKAAAPHINAPLDSVPAAQRASPLKQEPGNIHLHAHQGAQGRRNQGKRDSR